MSVDVQRACAIALDMLGERCEPAVIEEVASSCEREAERWREPGLWLEAAAQLRALIDEEEP